MFNRLDLSSIAPSIQVERTFKAKSKAKVTKATKPSKSERRAKTLRENFPSVSQKIPEKVNNPQKVALLEKLYKDLTPEEQEKFQSLKTYASNKASWKAKRAARKLAGA